MKKYIKFKKIMVKREKIDKIKLLFNFILNIFQNEDRAKIITIFLSMLKIGTLFEFIIFSSMFFFATYYIKWECVLPFVDLLLFIFLIFLNISKSEIIKLREEIIFLCNITKNYKDIFIKKMILCFIKEKFGKYMFICITFSCFSYNLFLEKNNLLFCSLLIGLVFLFNIFVYNFIKNICLSNQEENITYKIKLMKVNKNNVYIELIKRLILDVQLKRKIFFIILLEIFIIIVSYTLILTYFNLSLNYLNILCFSFFPAIINSILTKFSTDLLLNPKVVIVNYYLLKKYNGRKYIMKTTFVELVKLFIVFPISLFIIVIINKGESEVVLLFVFSILQYLSICGIVTKKWLNFKNYDFDEMKRAHVFMMDSILEDYFLIGSPVILISLFIIKTINSSNLNLFILFIFIYTIILSIYGILTFCNLGGRKNVAHK